MHFILFGVVGGIAAIILGFGAFVGYRRSQGLDVQPCPLGWNFHQDNSHGMPQ